MENFTYLFGIYGAWSWALLLGCSLLGLLFARVNWCVGAKQVAKMQKERFEMEQEVQQLRQNFDWTSEEASTVPSTQGSAGLDLGSDFDFDQPAGSTAGKSALIGGFEDTLHTTGAAGASSLIIDSSAPVSLNQREAIQQHFAEEAVRLDSELGIIYEVEPENVDPIRIIKGLGPRIERNLNELGIFKFKQIAHWNSENVLQVTNNLPQFLIRIDRDKWISQARELWALVANRDEASYHAPDDTDHESKVFTDFAGEPVTADADCGVLYHQAPDVADELPLITGVGPMMVDLMYQNGIYRFKQISNWSRHNVEHIAPRLNTTADRISSERWVPQARRLFWETYSASPEWGNAKPTLSDYSRRIETDYSTENVKADADLGVIYKDQPPNADDLTQLAGLDSDFITTLNQMGIWRFRQIADWSEANVRTVARKLKMKPERVYQLGWIRQAWALAELARKKAAFAGESFRTDPGMGILYYTEPMSADHLIKIDGLTPRVAGVLNEQGVFTYKQIGLWDADNIRAFAQIIGVDKNEIFRNRWVTQADELHYKKYGTEL